MDLKCSKSAKLSLAMRELYHILINLLEIFRLEMKKKKEKRNQFNQFTTYLPLYFQCQILISDFLKGLTHVLGTISLCNFTPYLLANRTKC